jgi:hypothetical protein
MTELIGQILLPHSNLIVGLIVLIAAILLILVVIYVVAFVQGRALYFWPPRIGKKTAPAAVAQPVHNDVDKTSVPSKENIVIGTVVPDKFSHNTVALGERNRVLIGNLRTKIAAIQDRISHGHNMPFVLLGSTYLDVIVGPVSTKTLGAEEWTDIDSIRVGAGGSAMCVGRYLWADYKQKSYLFTPVGENEDIFSSEFRKLLDHEKQTWLIPCPLSQPPRDSVPMTFLLRQLDQSFSTMFTHKGALSSFGWDNVQPQISELLNSGGILYLSGFMKTNLSHELVGNLRVVHPKAVICLDHGRLNLRTDNPSVVKAVYDAYTSGLIDVYICTLNEISNFYQIVSGNVIEPNNDNAFSILESIARTEILPPVTIVRNTIQGKSVAAYSIVDGTVDAIPDHSRRWFDNTPVAPLNAFNAAFMHHFITDSVDSSDGLRGHVINVSQKGLTACHCLRENDPSSI